MLTAATAEQRALTDDERLRANGLTAQVDKLEADLKRERAQLEYDRREAKPIAWPGSAEGLPRPGAAAVEGKLSYRALFGEPSR
jgi:hypothetical protein